MRLTTEFRNIDLDTSASIAELSFEAIQTIMSRGSLQDWQLLGAEIKRNPWGELARNVETIAGWNENYGVDALFLRHIEQSRSDVRRRAKLRFARRIRHLRRTLGLTLEQMAGRIGTSVSRLSDYENAKVSPTSEVLGRIELLIGPLTDGPDNPPVES